MEFRNLLVLRIVLARATIQLEPAVTFVLKQAYPGISRRPGVIRDEAIVLGDCQLLYVIEVSFVPCLPKSVVVLHY